MHRLRPLYRIAWCRRPLLQSNRRFISSQNTQPTNAPHGFQSLPPEWEDEAPSLSDFTELPHKDFGKNQLMETNEEFKRALRGILKQFPPITYAFAYGSGVFPQSAATASRATQSPHPDPPEAILKWQKGGGKMIDFILTPKFSQHFHSLNLREHRDHYSFLGTLGSGVVSHVQDRYGAGAYFNPYITVNGTLIKYAVVNFETLLRDLTDWDTLYFAGRLHKPVKILFEEPNIRVANQRNLLSAVRCSLLLLPPTFTEKELYSTITGLSYQGDPRMQFGTIAKSGWMDNPGLDLKLSQDMDPERRANMVRRLPKKFREKVYFQYRGKFGISGRDYQEMLESSKDEDAKGSLKKQVAGAFDKRIAGETDLPQMVTKAINQTVKWPSTVQSLKGVLTAGPSRAWRYLAEKREKGKIKDA
ncbi:Mitochondrial translocator assembly and maintenance protein 41 [Neocucurbitaria cava]|uniref:Phosphatidate cytidylyltransferase, mitochondrial n=1 Tax=Neocucurbitaria cava TaxID=798079 RepID=A0A9W8YCJ3_9PLEO|nr:Mitochondrial translocator assembly and maintenance protein 41 [Neocucurbitaria cava]